MRQAGPNPSCSKSKKATLSVAFSLSGGEGGSIQKSLWAVLALRASRLRRSMPNRCVWSNLRFSSLGSQPKQERLQTEALLFRWRRGRDSNPRYVAYTHFPGVRLRPLGHLSVGAEFSKLMPALHTSNSESGAQKEVPISKVKWNFSEDCGPFKSR